MKFWSVISILILLTLALVAFLTLADKKEPIHLTLTTGQKTATYYPLGKLIAEAVEKHNPNIVVTVLESDGSIENAKQLANGTADLAIIQNDTTVDGSVRSLIPLHRGIMHFLVRNGSEIRRFEHLQGKRVALGLDGSGSRRVVNQLLIHFGIDLSQINEFNKPLEEASDALLAGEIDAVLFMASVDSDAARNLLRSGKVHYVSLASIDRPGDEIDGFAISYPYIEKYRIPIAMHPIENQPSQPTEPCVTFAVRSTLAARSDLPDEIAEQIVQAIVTNRSYMMHKNQAASEITEQFSKRDIQFPLHDGAVAYFQRENPTWLERYAETMAFLLSVALLIFGGIVSFRNWILRYKKNRIDAYYSRLDAILTELAETQQDVGRLNEIDRELEAMRQQAVKELVAERLTADESFRIFQSLLNACQRQLALRRNSLQNANDDGV